MISKPKQTQGLVFAKQAVAADVEGDGSRWQQQAAVESKQGSRRLPYHMPASQTGLELAWQTHCTAHGRYDAVAAGE